MESYFVLNTWKENASCKTCKIEFRFIENKYIRVLGKVISFLRVVNNTFRGKYSSDSLTNIITVSGLNECSGNY